MPEHRRYEMPGPFGPEENEVHVIIDTPRGSRNKFKWDEKFGLFKVSHVLTAGAVFPFDFGFIPATHGKDGDALDVLVLTDEPLFPGCLITARLVAVIEAQQTQDGKTFSNDRLIGVAKISRDFAAIKNLADLRPNIIEEIEHFFIGYNVMRNRVFKPSARGDAERAMALVKAAIDSERA